MDKSILKEIILEQKERLKNLEIGIEREKLSEIGKQVRFPHSLVIAGIRRVGKSILLLQIMEQFYKGDCYYFNFEDERLLNFFSKDFNALYEVFIELFGKKKIFFFDEIQNINGWEAFIRRMQEQGIKFYLTGSNASLLSKELGTKLTGRYISLELFPFSFSEFLKFEKKEIKKNTFYISEERAKIKRYFNRYLKEGGMPEYLKYKNPDILKNLYEDILYRDIVARYELKEIKALRELCLYLFTNLGNLISFNKLKEILKLGSVNTVKSYIDYLENSFLVFTVNIFSYSLKQQFIGPKKVYCIDNGLANAISFRFSKDRGRFLENLVFIELKRRGRDIFYYRTKNNQEIDFLLREKGRPKELIQVSQNLGTEELKKREVDGLIKALEELKLNKGLILTEDEEETVKLKKKTVEIMPIYKWLLERY